MTTSKSTKQSPRRSHNERVAALMDWEAKGIVRDVEITSPGDGSRRFCFTAVHNGERFALYSAHLDFWMAGAAAGFAVNVKPAAKRAPAKRTAAAAKPPAAAKKAPAAKLTVVAGR